MITRRDTFVAALAAGGTAVAFVLPWQRLGSLVSGSRQAATGLGTGFDAMLGALDGTAEVGQAWLSSQEQAWTASTLAQALDTRIGPLAGETAQVETRIAAAIAADFADAALCQIEGWQLSRTECELAGLRWLALGDAPATVIDEEPAPKTPTDADAPAIAQITAWGPQSTEQDMPFNLQPDGHSGLWFQAQGVPSWAVVRIDGVAAPTQVQESGFTSGLFGEQQTRILARPGRYPIELYDPMREVAQPIGELVVRERAERVQRADGSRSEVFCAVTGWGPTSTRAGIAANPLPDGSLGLWFQLACAPRRVQLRFGDDRLRATRGDTAVTARVPLALIESPRVVPLFLRDVETGEELAVGDFHILDPATP
ncbi:hypothetical protein [Chiayiivirga flava]|uniref:Uncharacterized protein n=1 Tax=Chiayiivirga flava TaxID=659595 RepID=A0A7W8D5P2_9GAMM|nr:hypothetical protein [Chiayiivirga flava]MBB5208399.1 hypothetical protein [Chiayiivirga flava]